MKGTIIVRESQRSANLFHLTLKTKHLLAFARSDPNDSRPIDVWKSAKLHVRKVEGRETANGFSQLIGDFGDERCIGVAKEF